MNPPDDHPRRPQLSPWAAAVRPFPKPTAGPQPAARQTSSASPAALEASRRLREETDALIDRITPMLDDVADVVAGNGRQPGQARMLIARAAACAALKHGFRAPLVGFMLRVLADEIDPPPSAPQGRRLKAAA